MADILKRLAGPTQLGTSATTIYTAPASTTVTITDINVCNEAGGSSPVGLSLSIGTAGAGKYLYNGFLIEPKATLVRTGVIVLAAGEVIQAFASAGSSLTLTINGVEST